MLRTVTFVIATAVFVATGDQLTRAWQYTTSCRESTPRLEHLASAIQRGDLEFVRGTLDGGGDVNETWRDTPAQICRSLLLRSLWYGKEDLFRLLLKRGADPLSVPRESLQIPVRGGRVGFVRMLFAAGFRPHDNDEIVRAGLESSSVEMLDLLISSGHAIDASNVQSYFLTNEVTRFLVPKHLKPNDRTHLGGEACAIEAIFGLIGPDHDGCEGTAGPVWLHFVVTGNHDMVEFMIKNGADLSLGAEVWDGDEFRPFTAMDVAAKRNDKRLLDLLRRAAARAR